MAEHCQQSAVNYTSTGNPLWSNVSHLSLNLSSRIRYTVSSLVSKLEALKII